MGTPQPIAFSKAELYSFSTESMIRRKENVKN